MQEAAIISKYIQPSAFTDLCRLSSGRHLANLVIFIGPAPLACRNPMTIVRTHLPFLYCLRHVSKNSSALYLFFIGRCQYLSVTCYTIPICSVDLKAKCRGHASLQLCGLDLRSNDRFVLRNGSRHLCTLDICINLNLYDSQFRKLNDACLSFMV